MKELIEKLKEDLEYYGTSKFVIGHIVELFEPYICIKRKQLEELREKTFVNLKFIKIKDGSIIPHQRLILFKDVEKVLGDAPQKELKK